MNTSFSGGRAALGPMMSGSPQFKSTGKFQGSPVQFGFNSNKKMPDVPGMSSMPDEPEPKQGLLNRVINRFRKNP